MKNYPLKATKIAITFYLIIYAIGISIYWLEIGVMKKTGPTWNFIYFVVTHFWILRLPLISKDYLVNSFLWGLPTFALLGLIIDAINKIIIQKR